MTGNRKLNTIEFYPDFDANSTSAYDREGFALINLLYNFSFDDNIEELKEGYNSQRDAWDKKKDKKGVRPYKALHILNNKLNNFNIKDDVSIVLELNGIHG